MPLRIIWRNGWVTGNRTAYDFLGPRYCPKAYSLQVFFFINENKVLGIVPKKLQAHIAIENISCERVLCRGIWTFTLKMPRLKTLDISSLKKITVLPNKFVLSKSKSTMTCTCNPHETGKRWWAKLEIVFVTAIGKPADQSWLLIGPHIFGFSHWLSAARLGSCELSSPFFQRSHIEKGFGWYFSRSHRQVPI